MHVCGVYYVQTHKRCVHVFHARGKLRISVLARTRRELREAHACGMVFILAHFYCVCVFLECFCRWRFYCVESYIACTIHTKSFKSANRLRVLYRADQTQIASVGFSRMFFLIGFFFFDFRAAYTKSSLLRRYRRHIHTDDSCVQ